MTEKEEILAALESLSKKALESDNATERELTGFLWDNLDNVYEQLLPLDYEEEGEVA